MPVSYTHLDVYKRQAIPRVEMNELDAEYRSHSRKEEVDVYKRQTQWF